MVNAAAALAIVGIVVIVCVGGAIIGIDGGVAFVCASAVVFDTEKYYASIGSALIQQTHSSHLLGWVSQLGANP